MPENPFDVTKAVDFTDEEIARNWVDLPGGGFESIADPTSAMPRFLVGGKGGGRTHLLRYYSYSLQRIRHRTDLLNGIRTEGYLGIYFRCGGLNSSRFSGKGIPDDHWASLFAFYSDVWLARLVIDVLLDLSNQATGLRAPLGKRRAFAEACDALFDVAGATSGLGDEASSEPVREALKALTSIQRRLDQSINNAGLTGELSGEILATPGRLVFGVPAALAAFPQLEGIRVAYLIDEFENLTAPQQRYVNTLIREKELPSTFLVGSRQFGVRTLETLSAGEENVQGSEFDLVELEDIYRQAKKEYDTFCSGIVLKRLSEAEIGLDARRVEFLFEKSADSVRSMAENAQRLTTIRDHQGLERPWLRRLRRQLGDAAAPDVDRVMEVVQFPESPLHEKFSVLLLYRDWSRGRDLLTELGARRKEIERLVGGGPSKSRIEAAFKHYAADLYAQLTVEQDRPLEYAGFHTFIRLSSYLPRNLLIILKQITKWSLFLGENPYKGGTVSLRAQREGVRESSEWFLRDSRGLGEPGIHTEAAVRRVGGYLRSLRFADKPVEVSCTSFSTDLQAVSEEARRAIDDAVQHSLLWEIPGGRPDRNSGVRHRKYQLSPMLSPLFDLPVVRRGVASLDANTVNAIFDPSRSESEYNAILRRRVAALSAPFGGGDPQPRLDIL